MTIKASDDALTIYRLRNQTQAMSWTNIAAILGKSRGEIRRLYADEAQRQHALNIKRASDSIR